MLHWVLVILISNGYWGAPTTIGNFSSKENCQKAFKNILDENDYFKRHIAQGICVEIK